MIYGARTFVPFGIGVVLSIFFSFIYFNNNVDNNIQEEESQKCFSLTPATVLKSSEKNFIDSSGDWKVIVEKLFTNNSTANTVPQSVKVKNLLFNK